MTPRGFVEFSRGSALTVGTFDGVHLGHRAIVEELNRCAEARELPAAVVTFTPHPLAVVNAAAAPKLLTPGPERLAALADLGPPRAIVIPFSSALAALSAEEVVRLLVTRSALR